MMYVKTYESFLSNFFPKKIPTYPYNSIYSREYESIFVKDSFVDMGSVMKKVNENVVPSEDNNNLLPLERSEYIEYMSGVLDKLNIEYTIDGNTRARHILKIKNEFHPIIILSYIKDGRRISYIMDITGRDENPHIHTKSGLMNELLRSMGVNMGGVMKKINESLPSNNKDNIIPLDMKEYITYINSILDKFNIPYEYFYNDDHSESNHIVNKKIQLKSFISMVGDRGLFRAIGNDDDYIYNKSDVVHYLLNLLNINMGDVMKKINKK